MDPAPVTYPTWVYLLLVGWVAAIIGGLAWLIFGDGESDKTRRP